MSRKDSDNTPDSEEDINEVSSDDDSVEIEENDVRQRIGMPLDDFNALFKKLYMTPKLFEWLRSNKAYVDFIREIVISSLEGLGYPSKKTIPAGQHPIWSKVTTDQCLKGFREDPSLKGAEAQKQWLKKLAIKGAPEGGFKVSDYDTATHFVSQTWRRYRNALKSKVMAVAFSDTWGTEDFVVAHGPDLIEFFETEAGAKQLRHWVLQSLMNIDESMIDCVTPPANYVAYVKGLLITLRSNYESHEEMKRKEPSKSKKKSAEKLDERMRKKYNRTLEESSESDQEDSPSPNELQEEEPKKTKNTQASIPIKKRQLVNKTSDEDFVEEQQPPRVSKPATKRTEKESATNKGSETSSSSKKIKAKPATKPVEQPSAAKKGTNAAKLAAELAQKLQNARSENNYVRLTKKNSEKEEKEKSQKKKTPLADLAPTRSSQRSKERESNNTNVPKAKSKKRTAQDAELSTSGSSKKKQCKSP